MKTFVILSVLVAGAICARLDNTYIPPANAQSAGGFNLDAPKQAFASNNLQTYAPAPTGGRVQTQHQQAAYNAPGLNHGTFTSVSRGNGYQSVSAGSYSGNAGHGGFQQQQSHPAPQQNYQQQPTYQQQQPSYQSPQAQPQYNNYQQNQQSHTTPIPILKYENEPHQGDGRYRFEYLTGNGIMAQEEGHLNNPNAQYPDSPEQVAIGSYSYTAPDGQQISLRYKADAGGFQPEGAHLPVAPDFEPAYYEQVALQAKIAAEVEAEGQRILQLQAQLAQNQPQQNQYQQQGQHGQQHGQQYGQQAQHAQPAYNYQPQASSNVYQQQPAHAGYNQNAQPVSSSNPQQQYLPPQKYGKK